MTCLILAFVLVATVFAWAWIDLYDIQKKQWPKKLFFVHPNNLNPFGHVLMGIAIVTFACGIMYQFEFARDRAVLWAWLPGIPLVIYHLVREFFQDGHLIRLIKGTEPKSELYDFIYDLYTRFAGVAAGSCIVQAIVSEMA